MTDVAPPPVLTDVSAPPPPVMFGPYRLDALIGRGGMGEIHRAYDTVRERIVALKRLPPSLASDPVYQARFRSEAALAARLHEPHVIPIHDYGEIDGLLYIDMRLVDGPDLARLLRRDGPLRPERAVEIVAQVAAALDAAHGAGLVHRDIKPGNILLTHSAGDGADFVYVADFGIARAADTAGATSLTSTGTTVGSLDYMAPERFGSHGDHRADIYALGCVLHEALTAQRPFPVEGLPAIINAHLNVPPPRPSAVRPGLPAGLDAVVARAMAKDPDARFASAGALAAAAHHAVRTESQRTVVLPRSAPPVPPRGPRPLRGAHRPPPRRRGLIAAAAVAVAAVMAAALLTTQALGQGSTPPEILAESAAGPGHDPFMSSVTTRPPMPAPPVDIAGPVSGDTVGLYGGTLNNADCDQATMVSFLQAHPDKAQAWADVEGIPVTDVPSYITGLTPVLLRSDTAVTNHGFADGRATTVNSVFQAATAVLVDRFGVPRARCACGNPLTAAESLTAPTYIGDRWPTFSPAKIVTVTPAPAPLTELTLVDPATQARFIRPIGTSGSKDRPVTPTAPTTVPAPPAPTTAPAPAPPAPAPDSGSSSDNGGGPAPKPNPNPNPNPGPAPGGGNPPPPRPDLTPTPITFDPAAVVAGRPIQFASGVRNSGGSAAAFTVRWLVDGKDGASGLHAGIPADSTVTDSRFTTALGPGQHTITFAVDVDNAVPEPDERDNTTSIAVRVPDPTPDLSPTGISHDKSTLVAGTQIRFTAGVRNTGGAAGPFTVTWLVDGKDVGVTRSHAGIPANTTTPGDDSQFTTPLPEGPHTITFTIDAGSAVAESDEGNNAVTVSVPVDRAQPVLPDLSPAGITYDKAAAAAGKPTGFTVGVRNAGAAAAGAFGVTLTVDGKVVGSGSVGGLAARGTASAGPFTTTLGPGAHTITVAVDSGNAVTESNEGNNAVTVSVTVAPIQPVLPDLSPAGITFDKAAAAAGKPTGFTVGVRNAGAAAAGAFGVTLTVDGKVVGSGSVAGLAGRGTASAGPFTTTLGPGTHTITATVDSGKAVTESNEGNNAATVTVTVAAPKPPDPPKPIEQPKPADLSATGISYNKASVAAGKQIGFAAGVRNLGGTASGAFTVTWLVDGKDVGAGGGHAGVPAGASGGNSQLSATLVPGRHTITFTVDADNAVTESNERNNSVTITVTVPDKSTKTTTTTTATTTGTVTG